MIKNRLLIRVVFVVATIAVLGTAYALAQRTGLLNNIANRPPAETDPLKILQKIHRYYDKDSVIGQSCTIRLYSKKEPKNILEQYDCIFYSGKDQVYSRLGPGETYCNKDLLIAADLDNKTMQVMPSQPELLSMNIPAVKELKKMVSESKGQLNVIEEDGRQVLTYQSEFDTEVKNYRLYFDPVTWALTSVKMEVWKDDAFLQKDPEPLTMEIRFGQLKTLNSFPEKFGHNRFLKLSGDSLSLQPDYLDFELMNQLNLPVK